MSAQSTISCSTASVIAFYPYKRSTRWRPYFVPEWPNYNKNSRCNASSFARHLERRPVILRCAQDLCVRLARSKARAQDDRQDTSQGRLYGLPTSSGGVGQHIV